MYNPKVPYFGTLEPISSISEWLVKMILRFSGPGLSLPKTLTTESHKNSRKFTKYTSLGSYPKVSIDESVIFMHKGLKQKPA